MTIHQGQAVFNTPDSASAARLLSSLESAGFSDTSLTGPTMEHVFLRVAGEEDDVAMGASSLSTDTSPLTWGSGTVEGQLTSGSVTSFWQQSLALLIKRLAVLRRGFWWYVVVLAIPLILTPVFDAMINYPDPFEPTACINSEPTELDRPWPIHLLSAGYFDQAGSSNISILVGPRSINGTLFRAVSSFPFGEEYDIDGYRENFLFQNDFDGFLQHVRDKPKDLTPGALYMGDGSNPPTFAYNAELRSDASMLMQNLWSQLQNGVPIALSFAYFSSSVPVSLFLVESINQFCQLT
jgi:ATP-binding cassette subfamily A (ABC1) protein 3